jgi:hypothetical protein
MILALAATTAACMTAPDERPAASTPARAATAQTAPAIGAGPALTLYSGGFGVVRELVPLELGAGVTRASFSGVTQYAEPDSVILRDPTGRVRLQVLEQSYRSQVANQDYLLSLFEGQTIPFHLWTDGTLHVIQGRIVRSGFRTGVAPIVEVDGELQFQLPGMPRFPKLPDDTILEPTLEWTLASDQAGRVDAELAYVTGGFGWKADYNAVAPEHGDVLDITGWITFTNSSGTDFADARVKLIAGDVSKLAPPAGRAGDAWKLGMLMESDMAAAVTEKSFDEFHLYTLARPTTLRSGEQKQVEFVRGERVNAPRLYVYDGASLESYYGWDPISARGEPSYGTQCNKKVWVMREIENRAENGLGIPLPAGRVRFYRQDDDGRLEFVGENSLDHTPKDELVRLYTGNAFDVVGERTATDFQIDTSRETIDESFEIVLKNHKAEPVEVRVVEHLYRWSTWEIQKPSMPFTKKDARTIEFRVPVAAGGEARVTYSAHYTW